MGDVIVEGISATKVLRALQQLLESYLSEREKSQRDEDEHHVEYWDSACQTIDAVAEALDIPLEVQGEQPKSVSP